MLIRDQHLWGGKKKEGRSRMRKRRKKNKINCDASWTKLPPAQGRRF